MPTPLPFTLVPDTIADADQVMADFLALTAKLDNLTDVNIAANADLDANKLSTTAGKRVAETRMETNAVSQRVLASDASTPGNDAGRAVTGNHVTAWTIAQVLRIIPATSITGSMLAVGAAAANLVGAVFGLDKLKVTVHSVTVNNPASFDPATAATRTAANPTATFAKATYELLGCYARPGTANIATAVPTVLPDDSGANWAGWLYLGRSGGGVVAGTIFVTYVFISRT